MGKGSKMARKATVTENRILDSAFALMREEGFEQVTARRLAAKAGCSTQPIFRLYENMDQLIGVVYEQAIAYFETFCAFLDLGMAYIHFAEAEKNMFRLLFMSGYRGEKSMYELLNGRSGVIGKEVARARAKGVKKPGEVFMKMWIFIHGCACMALTGDFDLTPEETAVLLTESYRACAEAN